MSDAIQALHFGQALTPKGWQSDVRVTIRCGAIAELEVEAPARVGDVRHAVGVPGTANLHSHAFQRAVSGLAEQRGTGEDSFWSWREAMYRFALVMTPDQAEAVAAQAYMEMLEAGYTRVGEFHYLHHAPDGRLYADIAEMSARIVAAAGTAGIGLTLLPVFYAHSGFGGAAPADAQRRFICAADLFARLLDGALDAARTLDGARVGVAPHSLRAVTPDELTVLQGLAAQGPLHIHVAEQVAEVDACLVWSGARPVEWLLDHADVDGRWCLIHATHMTDVETSRLAASGAIVGLCPITEANLGDGLFNAPKFQAAGGRFGIGTDSNVRIALAGELELLEYGQRLEHRARNVLARPGQSTGRALFDGAQAGAVALGAASAGLVAGAEADVVTLRGQTSGTGARRGDAILDAWIFSGAGLVDCVYARGRAVVRDGVHVKREAIARRFGTAMNELLGA